MRGASTVLLVASEGGELAGVWRRCRRRSALRANLRFCRAGELNGRRVLMAADGPGRARARLAAETVLSMVPVDLVVSSGYCGALDPALRAGDVFVADSVGTADGAPEAAAVPVACRRPHVRGRLLSGARVVQTVEERRGFYELGFRAVEMEAAGVAGAAGERGVPFACIRVVTDEAGENLYIDYNGIIGRSGFLSRPRIVLAACRRPAVLWPELIRMYGRSRAAARNLGDFLADCEF